MHLEGSGVLPLKRSRPQESQLHPAVKHLGGWGAPRSLTSGTHPAAQEGRGSAPFSQTGKWRLTRSPIQSSLGTSQGQEASFLEVLGGQVAGDGRRPHALLPHQVTVFKESWVEKEKHVSSASAGKTVEGELHFTRRHEAPTATPPLPVPSDKVQSKQHRTCSQRLGFEARPQDYLNLSFLTC